LHKQFLWDYSTAAVVALALPIANCHLLIALELSFPRRRPLELKLELLHSYALAAELYTFGFQSKALFHATLPGQGDAPSGGNHPLPGQTVRTLQSAHDLAGGSGKARGASDGSVS
jgi:hypothetical protein